MMFCAVGTDEKGRNESGSSLVAGLGGQAFGVFLTHQIGQHRDDALLIATCKRLRQEQLDRCFESVVWYGNNQRVARTFGV